MVVFYWPLRPTISVSIIESQTQLHVTGQIYITQRTKILLATRLHFNVWTDKEHYNNIILLKTYIEIEYNLIDKLFLDNYDINYQNDSAKVFVI